MNRLKQIILWLWRGRYHMLSIVSFLTVILYLTKVLQFYPSIVALIMTMAGLLIILSQQIADAAKFGSHKPNTFSGWLKSFPAGKSFTLSANGAMSARVSLKAHAQVTVSPEATLEKKIDFLLGQVAALDSAIARIDDRVDEVNSLLKKASQKLQSSVNALETTLNNIIASHVVGSYDVSLFGINITICGTVIQFFCS